MPRSLVVLGAAALVAAGAAVVAIADGETPSPVAGSPLSQAPVRGGKMVAMTGNSSVAAARRFAGFPVYWVGPAHSGLDLVATQREEGARRSREPVRASYVSFVYGLCEIEPGDEGGCQPPLQVQAWDACDRNRESYGPHFQPDRELRVRGVPAAIFEQDTRLELYTGRSTIVLSTSRPGADFLLEAVRALRGVNVPVAAGGPLDASPGRACAP